MLIDRDILPQLIDHLNRREITLLIGPRQAGKTTLLVKLMEVLQSQDIGYVYLNLDRESDQVHLKSQQWLLEYIRLQPGSERKTIFIDEIQQKEDAGRFLKGIYDTEPNLKFVVTGSGSLELKEKIQESLAGRKRIFSIPTLTFTEFFHFKTQNQYRKKISDWFELNTSQADSLLKEYLFFGGYPRVVLAQTHQEKQVEMAELYDSYVLKDVKALLQVQKPEVFTQLLTVIASQIGQLVEFSSISNQVNLDILTVKKYLWYAYKTFILKRVNPFFTNPQKELSKMPTYYFQDLGMRNFALNQLTYFEPIAQGGFLFENLVYRLLLETSTPIKPKINFWRTKDKAEVDFVVNRGVERVPVEVKYSHLKSVKISRSFRSFLGKYKPPRAYIVNLSFSGKNRVGDTDVWVIPYWKLLQKDVLLWG